MIDLSKSHLEIWNSSLDTSTKYFVDLLAFSVPVLGICIVLGILLGILMWLIEIYDKRRER